MYTPDQLKDFEQEYEEAKIYKGYNNTVTDRDLMILHDYKSGKLEGELASKYRTSRGAIHSALRRAALSKI